jgi:hypothetical protein
MPDRGLPDRGLPDRGLPDRAQPPTGTVDAPLSARVLALLDRLTATGGGAASAEVDAELAKARAALVEPLRVAVAGRLKSGKSTLVNALLGRVVAETDVGECTRVVTVFRYGFPERAVVEPRDGPPRDFPLTFDGRVPASLPVDPARARAVNVFLTDDRLHSLILIDTPGLASTRETYVAATRELLAIDGASRSAINSADALVFLLTDTVREDDRSVINAFRELFGATNSSAVNAVGVVGRADTVCLNDPDPLAGAARLAVRHRELLRPLVSTVLPVVGLWAESARSGGLTEHDAAVLRAIAALPTAAREQLLLSARIFAAAPEAAGPSAEAAAAAGHATVPAAASDRLRLLRHLGLLGVRRCLDWLDAGVRSASGLAARLEAASGVRALEAEGLGALAQRRDVLKADAALRAVERIGAQAGRQASALREEVEALRLHPSMHRLVVLPAIEQVAAGAVQLPRDLMLDMERIATGARVTDQLGLPPYAPAEAVASAAAAGAARWLRFANDGRASPEEKRIARAMYREYAALRAQLPGMSPPPW